MSWRRDTNHVHAFQLHQRISEDPWGTMQLMFELGIDDVNEDIASNLVPNSEYGYVITFLNVMYYSQFF